MNNSVVMAYIISLWIVWGIVLILLLILFAVFSFIKPIRRYRWWTLVLISLFTIYVAVPTVQGYMDIKNNSYVTEHVEYYRAEKSNTRNSFVAADSIQITLDSGRTVILKGPQNDMPFGKCTGVITYAKRSKITVAFVPDTVP